MNVRLRWIRVTHHIAIHITAGGDGIEGKALAFFEGDFRNDCQQLVRQIHPEVDKALELLGNCTEARLPGTGACVFASFATAEIRLSYRSTL